MGVIKETTRRILIFLYYELIIKVIEELKDLISENTLQRIKEFFGNSFKPNSSIVVIIILTLYNVYLFGIFSRMAIIISFALLFIFLYLRRRWVIGEWLGWYRKKKEIQKIKT